MCGIAGIVYKNEYFLRDQVKDMTDTLVHRGPDGEGFYFGENFALGHRRLAIIDLSPAGHQPMEYEGLHGDYVIVFNGEIYNYLELRSELLKSGYVFRSNTDTEVILASYDKWGRDCLQKFNGMWAFVIYDKNKNILFGARDRFGVKPFYYIYSSHNFAFASEIKALLKLQGNEKELNESAVFDYLLFGFEEQEEEGFFKDVYELKPSWAMIFDLNTFNLKKYKYYELAYCTQYEVFEEGRLKSITSKLKELIFDAIRLRLRSDVPVGSCLSGGLDSSSVVCVINELLKKANISQIGERQKVFTAVYDDKLVDESTWANYVINQTKADWHRTYPTEESLITDLQDLIYYQEIPFGSTSIYAQYRVMKIAKEQGVKVILDGQGADELFTGYPTYYPVFYREILTSFDFNSLLRELRHIHNSPVTISYCLKNLTKSILADIIPTQIKASSYYLITSKAPYFRKTFLAKHKYRAEHYIASYPKKLNEQLHLFITGKNLKTLLRYEDRNSMRFSIESRTPFADDVRLIEYVFSIPSSYKIHKGWSKFLLRQAMSNVLPSEIIRRTDKVGFATPEKKWLMSNESFILDKINQKKSLIDDFINPNRLITEIKNRNVFKNGFLLWRVVNFMLWREVFEI